jgi:hypothetical protein
MAVLGTPGLCRDAQREERVFIEAAIALGASPLRVMGTARAAVDRRR